MTEREERISSPTTNSNEIIIIMPMGSSRRSSPIQDVLYMYPFWGVGSSSMEFFAQIDFSPTWINVSFGS